MSHWCRSTEVTEASTSDTGQSCRIPLRDKEGNVVDYALLSLILPVLLPGYNYLLKLRCCPEIC